jgi:hypothetical protein
LNVVALQGWSPGYEMSIWYIYLMILSIYHLPTHLTIMSTSFGRLAHLFIHLTINGHLG